MGLPDMMIMSRVLIRRRLLCLSIVFARVKSNFFNFLYRSSVDFFLVSCAVLRLVLLPEFFGRKLFSQSIALCPRRE